MAVVINEMQVEVEDKAAPATASQPTGRPRNRQSIRLDLEALAERQLRLKGD